MNDNSAWEIENTTTYKDPRFNVEWLVVDRKQEIEQITSGRTVAYRRIVLPISEKYVRPCCIRIKEITEDYKVRFTT